MYIGNVILLVLNLPLVGFWARIALLSIIWGIWIQVRTHAPEVAIEESDD